jgi:hypothetical protein
LKEKHKKCKTLRRNSAQIFISSHQGSRL